MGKINLICGSIMDRPFSSEGSTDYPNDKDMEQKKEMVNHPDHYNQGEIECIDAMISAYGKDVVMAFCKCSAFKYQWRMGHKDDESQEIGKIEWYLNKYKELKNAKL